MELLVEAFLELEGSLELELGEGSLVVMPEKVSVPEIKMVYTSYFT